MNKRDMLFQLRAEKKAKTESNVSVVPNTDTDSSFNSYYSRLNDKLNSKNISFTDNLKQYIYKTKRREKYLVAILVSKSDKLETIYITDNFLAYIQKLADSNNEDDICYSLDILFEKDSNEDIIAFLKRIENEAKVRRPSNFYQNYGELYYKINYHSPKHNSQMRLVSKKTETSHRKGVQKLSDVSKKKLIRSIKDSKTLSKRCEGKFNDDYDNVWFYQDFVEAENNNNEESIEEDETNEEVKEEAKEEIKEEVNGDTKYEEMVRQVEENFLSVTYTPRTDGEIYDWVKEKRRNSLLFYKEYGGNSY